MVGDSPSLPDNRQRSPMKRENNIFFKMGAAINNRSLLHAKLLLVIALLLKKKMLLRRKKYYRKKRFWVRKIFEAREEQEAGAGKRKSIWGGGWGVVVGLHC